MTKKELEKENKELKKTFVEAQNILKETQFFASKLTHVYKLLMSGVELSMDEKIKMSEEFDSASDENEAKAIYKRYLEKKKK